MWIIPSVLLELLMCGKEIHCTIMTTLQKIQLVCAGILLLCVLPMPYGYFTIVRVATTIVSAHLAYNYYTDNKKWLAIAFAIIAVLFQPLIKFALGREIWLVVDIIVAILLIVLALRKQKNSSEE